MQVLWQNTGLNICICVEGGFWSHVTSNIMHYPILSVYRKRFIWLLCFFALRSSQHGTEKASKASVCPCAACDILCHECSIQSHSNNEAQDYTVMYQAQLHCSFVAALLACIVPCCIFRIFFGTKNLISNILSRIKWLLVYGPAHIYASTLRDEHFF